MRPQIKLLIEDEAGGVRPVLINSKRFTIGSGPDNDLILHAAGIARRHALIESFGEMIQLTGYDAKSALSLNQTPVREPVELHHGDLITLGDQCGLQVEISGAHGSSHTGVPTSAGKAQAGAASFRSGPLKKPLDRRDKVTHTPHKWTLSVGLIAFSAALLILLLAGLYLRLSGERRRMGRGDANNSQVGSGPNRTGPEGGSGEVKTSGTQNAESTPPLPNREQEAAAVSDKQASNKQESDDQLEEAAIQVMRRISSDNQPYGFSEQAVRQIARKVEEYRGSPSTLRAVFVNMQQGGAALAQSARHEGVEPYLVIYTALAQTDGGRARQDSLAVARAALPGLAAQRETFGSSSADSSLIMVAVYIEAGGKDTASSLLYQMGRLITDSYRQRNVWFLHEHGAISDRAYDFVLRFLALGVIAQNPRRYGVDAEPLNF
jgi:hypothetical protein